LKQHLPAAIAALALGVTSCAAHADLTINGAVGMPLNPTAELPAPGHGTVQGAYLDMGNSNGAKFKDYSVVGAFSGGKGLEINGGYNGLNEIPNTGMDTKGLDYGAKYGFDQVSSLPGVRFAVGAGHSHSVADDTYGYLVATKSFAHESAGLFPVRLSVGVRYDDFKLVTSKETSGYAGAEVPLTPSGTFEAVGEIQSKNVEGGNSPYSVSLRFRPSNSELSVSAGVARQGLTAQSGLFASVGFNFGPK